MLDNNLQFGFCIKLLFNKVEIMKVIEGKIHVINAIYVFMNVISDMKY